MKITKIPGLGRFGVFIDDLDFNNLSDEEWMHIGEVHLESLVTIIRDANCDIHEYERRITQWGEPISLSQYRILKKYKTEQMVLLLTQDEVNGVTVDEDDRMWVASILRMLPLEETGRQTKMLRVSGKKNDEGKALGMFSEGELLWHSNESGQLCFSPAVSLMGQEGLVGSSTGFLTTVDWYEDQSESFRSELDEMIIEHRFTPGKISPGVPADEENVSYKAFCPEDNHLPLVLQSPAGIKGLHYTVNTTHSIRGMSYEDSQKLFEHINKTLFVEKYIYDHWYQRDNDICLFDNSITLHRRLGGVTNRLCYRIQHDYGYIKPDNWNPYFQEPYASEYISELDNIHKLLKLYNYK
jgi:alpha-ketoglutarate-dependent taurine dioxygenase